MSTKIPASHIRIKRAYEPSALDDGMRILIDRLWPRGVKKETLALSQWNKALSPSTELRQWRASGAYAHSALALDTMLHSHEGAHG